MMGIFAGRAETLSSRDWHAERSRVERSAAVIGAGGGLMISNLGDAEVRARLAAGGDDILYIWRV